MKYFLLAIAISAIVRADNSLAPSLQWVQALGDPFSTLATFSAVDTQGN